MYVRQHWTVVLRFHYVILYVLFLYLVFDLILIVFVINVGFMGKIWLFYVSFH